MRKSFENYVLLFSLRHTGLCDVHRWRCGIVADLWRLLLRQIQPADLLLVRYLMASQFLAQNLQLLADPFPAPVRVDRRGQERRTLLLIRCRILL